jgi:hypothetical protein
VLDDQVGLGERQAAPAPRDRSVPRWAIVVAVLVAVRLIAIVLLLNSGVEDKHSILGGDARRYEAILASHGTPYRDFEVEYPPVTLGLVHLVGMGTDVSGIDPTSSEFDGDLGMLTRLAVLQLAFELGAAALLAWGWNRRTGIAYLVLGTPFLFFPFPYVRIDLFTVFVAVLALSLVRKGFDRAGGVALGVAVLAKLWPIVVVPVVLVTDKRRSLLWWLITSAVGLALWLAFFGPAGFAQVATFRGSKGWQIESIPGVFFHMADHGASHVEQGAWRTGAQVPLVVKPLLPLLALGNAALAWWWARARHVRRTDDDEWAVWGLAPLASILGLLVFSTIISPQYVLWFVPFVAILAARGDRLITGLYLVTAILTTFILSSIHGQIEGQLYATVPIVIRNFCLIAMLAVALWRLSPRSQASPTANPCAGTTDRGHR